MHADLAPGTGADQADAAMDRVPRVVPARRLGQDLAQPRRGARRGVLLAVVVHLDHLDVVVRREDGRHLGAERKQEVHTDAHIGGRQDPPAALRQGLEGGLVFAGERRRPDHQHGTRSDDSRCCRHGIPGGGEVDDGVGAGEHVVEAGDDLHARRGDAGHDTGILTHERAAGKLDGARQDQLLIGLDLCHQHAAHPAGRTDHCGPDHGLPSFSLSLAASASPWAAPPGSSAASRRVRNLPSTPFM